MTAYRSLNAAGQGVFRLFCAKARKLSDLYAGSRTQSRTQSRLHLCLVVCRAHAARLLRLPAAQSTPLGCSLFAVPALHLHWLLKSKELPPPAPLALLLACCRCLRRWGCVGPGNFSVVVSADSRGSEEA